MKRLAEISEDQLVARLLRNLPTRANVLAGPGDDCAIIGRPRDAEWQLLKVDCVIEDIHFLRAADPRRVGWKALCRAISDIAAMGGEPQDALLTVAAPLSLEVAWLDGLYAGLRKASRRFHVAIVGGETARSPGPIFINVALTGRVERKNCVRRSGAKPGDHLFVTGKLGGSIGGKHLDFTPRLAEARWLTTHFKPRAMMDLSDGLAADLPRMAAASNCGIELDHLAIPCHRSCSVEQALGDGEDYELLFAVAPQVSTGLVSAWRREYPRLSLTRIGQLTRADSKLSLPKSTRGFDHFAPAK